MKTVVPEDVFIDSFAISINFLVLPMPFSPAIIFIMKIPPIINLVIKAFDLFSYFLLHIQVCLIMQTYFFYSLLHRVD